MIHFKNENISFFPFIDVLQSSPPAVVLCLDASPVSSLIFPVLSEHRRFAHKVTHEGYVLHCLPCFIACVRVSTLQLKEQISRYKNKNFRKTTSMFKDNGFVKIGQTVKKVIDDRHFNNEVKMTTEKVIYTCNSETTNPT